LRWQHLLFRTVFPLRGCQERLECCAVAVGPGAWFNKVPVETGVAFLDGCPEHGEKRSFRDWRTAPPAPENVVELASVVARLRAKAGRGFSSLVLSPVVTQDGVEIIYRVIGPHEGDYQLVELQSWRPYAYALVLGVAATRRELNVS